MNRGQLPVWKTRLIELRLDQCKLFISWILDEPRWSVPNSAAGGKVGQSEPGAAGTKTCWRLRMGITRAHES